MGEITEKDLQIILINTDKTKKDIQLEYSIKNISSKDIWLCVNTNRNKNPNYETDYDGINQKLKIKFGNYRVPSGLLIEEPIYAKFIKLSVGQKESFTIKIKLPIQSFNPLDGEGDTYYKLANLKELLLEFAYYDIDLEKFNDECCIPEDKSTMLVNCFWAENNLEKFDYLKVF